MHLDDMVLEANILFLLPGSVLHVEYANEIRRPAPDDSVEQL